MDNALAIERDAAAHLRTINKAIACGNSDIQQFYADTVVLITGGSGYMGKQLLEKLFRSCEIRKTYLVLRPKQGKSVEERLNEILKDPAYDNLHKNKPDFKQRIVPVEGDVGKLKLGISDENWKDITENVSVIFHVAATVKFNEPLRTAVQTNVRGTREVLQLATECALLKSFVYVSTAYSNVIRSRKGTMIEEQFYPSPVAPHVLIEITDSFDDERLQKMSSKLIDGWPNTYSYTKAVAEELVRTNGSGLPACIVRPAIVIGAYQEPLPGWIDRRAVHGTSGIGFGCIMGILHVVLCRGDVSVNFIPVDYVNNAIIAAARAVSTRRQEGRNEMMIYTVTCDRSFLWKHCIGTFNDVLSKLPSAQIAGDCFAVKVENTYAYYTLILLLHYIPAAIVDILSVLMGKMPWLTKLYNRIHKLSRLTKYFTVNNWLFSDKNTQELYQNMSESDRLIFNFDRNNLDMSKMMVLWALGLRMFVLKDGLKKTEIGRKKQMLFKLLCLGMLFIYLNVLFWLVRSVVGML